MECIGVQSTYHHRSTAMLAYDVTSLLIKAQDGSCLVHDSPLAPCLELLILPLSHLLPTGNELSLRSPPQSNYISSLSMDSESNSLQLSR